MAEYPINKGIGRPVEFKGLKAQYLFIFAGGLLAAFVLFVIIVSFLCLRVGCSLRRLILVFNLWAFPPVVGFSGLDGKPMV